MVFELELASERLLANKVALVSISPYALASESPPAFVSAEQFAIESPLALESMRAIQSWLASVSLSVIDWPLRR